MKKTILATALLTLFAGSAFAGSDNDHGADRLLNQQLAQMQEADMSTGKPAEQAARPVAKQSHFDEASAQKESRK
ncbi:hypothetical protein [Leeia aquatica]|uniref:Secreted protein n=1 Tax=Leeia aquatica TaxID=2725557 RepID=A0A847SHG6_9NEIS|nr:hypothetical protein [Leeia aquatica]NLR76619.1 hypothetical protein [Leeia aquatica]